MLNKEPYKKPYKKPTVSYELPFLLNINFYIHYINFYIHYINFYIHYINFYIHYINFYIQLYIKILTGFKCITLILKERFAEKSCCVKP